MLRRGAIRLLALAGIILGGLFVSYGQVPTAAGPVGNLCGVVFEESQTQVFEAEVALIAVGAAEPVVSALTNDRGGFCFTDLPAGSYTLEVAKKPWPNQPTRTVTVEAGNTTLTKIELEYEPGEPRGTFEESFDGMGPDEQRGVLERLLAAGDTESIHELARRLVPKRSVGIELGRLARGLDTRKLVDEMIRYLERGYLPPLKTARFLHALGELSQPGDTRIIPLLLSKLTDGRRLPPGNYVTWSGLYDPAKQYYVSDEALLALAKITGRDFKYELGRSPIANQRAINSAREWWRNELAKKQSRQ
ncbi:MAG: carboxypeptidase regulatory-like domain-containing protein [Acidobacteria bacterium]|nr:carboxypeptidase regulatory-like domain-containing protein [Acidobacteriota bacterium]